MRYGVVFLRLIRKLNCYLYCEGLPLVIRLRYGARIINLIGDADLGDSFANKKKINQPIPFQEYVNVEIRVMYLGYCTSKTNTTAKVQRCHALYILDATPRYPSCNWATTEPYIQVDD